MRSTCIAVMTFSVSCTFSGAPVTSGDGGTSADASVQSMVDRGLVARYFLDEAASGIGESFALDSAPNPADLPITSVGMLNYVEVGGNRGLRWSSVETNEGVFVQNINSTKFSSRLDGTRTATIEVVLEVDALNPDGSRMFHLGPPGGVGQLAMRTRGGGSGENDNPRPVHYWNAGRTVQWEPVVDGAGRIVLHQVTDTDSGRAELFLNGVAVTALQQSSLDPGAALDVEDAALGIGARPDGQRQTAWTIFYAAVYDEALTQAEIETNAARLAVSDDR